MNDTDTTPESPDYRACRHCLQPCVLIQSPGGSWWSHYIHPDDEHEADVPSSLTPIHDFVDGIVADLKEAKISFAFEMPIEDFVFALLRRAYRLEPIE